MHLGKSSSQPQPRRYRLGLYDPLDHSKPARLFGRVWSDSEYDQLQAQFVMEMHNATVAKRPASRMAIGLFPVRRRRSVPRRFNQG